MTHFLRRALFPAVLLTSTVLTRAGVSYDESPVFAFDTRDYTTGLAAESATFALDTRLVDGLQGAAVSASFAFDTRGVTLPPLQITGVLRDSMGVPVVGATIQIKRAGAIFWQGVSGAGGIFTPPSLSGVNYTVIVTKPGYVTSITNINGTAGGTLALNLQSAAMPAAPTATTVVRTLTGTEVRPAPTTNDPDAPALWRYNGSQLVTDMSGLNTGRMTVVISHGWVPKLDPNSMATALDWATSLASLIYQHHPGISQPPNILVWDWRQKAHTDIPQVDGAAEEGIELGKALQSGTVLGPSYAQHLHFVGHSLGTIVNRYACDYLHGSLQRGNPATRWQPTQTSPHVTLLDEAEVATLFGQKVITAAEYGWKVANLRGSNPVGGVAAGVVTGGIVAKLNWKYPIPKDAWWVDNYISAFGLKRDEAVNVCLLAPTVSMQTQAWSFDGLATAHSYAHQWYRNSVNPAAANSAAPAIGFGRSVEGAGQLQFPPSGTGVSGGSMWFENISTSNDILDLTQNRTDLGALGAFVGTGDMPIFVTATVPLATKLAQTGNDVLYHPLDALGQGVLNGYESSILWAGDIGGTAIVKTGQVVTATKEKVGLWWDATLDKASDILNSVNPDNVVNAPLSKGGYRILLQTQPPAFAAAGTGSGDQGESASAPTAGQPPYAWVTVTVPPNAGMMAFDFTVTGDPVDDRIACAVNGQSVFALAAKFISEGEPMSTDMIDVSAFAGQSIEVFFGLAGGTSTNCELAIDGLRFITVPTPKVAVGVAAGIASVKWPAAASGWTLESSETLAPGSWQTVPTDTGLTLDSGVATLQEAVSLPKKFYRLRRNP